MATVLLANPARMIERGAPHLIRNDEQLAAYTKALFKLTAEPDPTPAQVEAIELLTLLIERYEEEQARLPEAEPAEVLRFLLERHGLKQRDIAAELGGESVVSEVLRGKRKLNATHIEQLSRRFSVSPAVFFAA
ncbi:helix-turn-helix domain-containing protein [Telmatobacter bradus]|uniref:helix-turn-helix domain-containing protein n=1 Tax=Telmatobacter bradus TaxID=474953 RepID=UPI003B4399F7